MCGGGISCTEYVRKHKKIFIALAVAVVLLVVLAIGLYFGLTQDDDDKLPPPSDSILGIYTTAAVAANGYLCAGIGSDIMKFKEGNAVEAAIAALFCEGVISMHSMGLGGGFFMTIYFRENQTTVTLNARVAAPAESSEGMFHENPLLSQYGGMAAAVPGELKGYWEAFNKYKSGKVKWEDLVSPSVKLCNDGFKVSPFLGGFYKLMEDYIKNRATLRELLINPKTGSVWQEGDILKRPTYGKTLTEIATNGIEGFYSGNLGEEFIKDVNEAGGVMTMEDLKNYEVHWEPPVIAKFGNVTLYTPPAPAGGPLVTFILNILDGFIPASNNITTYQRITEALKYGFGKRTELGDPRFNESVLQIVKDLTSRSYAESIRSKISDSKTYSDPKHYGAKLSPRDYGTAHISVIAPNGDAVSVTSTINNRFGAGVLSKSTGIILNNEMDAFSTQKNSLPANLIQPGKRPLSSMSPAIFVNGNGDVQLITGAAGGLRIVGGVVQVCLYSLWFGKNIKEAIDHRRIHHQLFPMRLLYEDGFPKSVIKGLVKIGHEVARIDVGGVIATGIAVSGGKIYANSDFRRKGVVAGF